MKVFGFPTRSRFWPPTRSRRPTGPQTSCILYYKYYNKLAEEDCTNLGSFDFSAAEQQQKVETLRRGELFQNIVLIILVIVIVIIVEVVLVMITVMIMMIMLMMTMLMGMMIMKTKMAMVTMTMLMGMMMMT